MKKLVKILYYLFLISSILTIASILFTNFPEPTGDNPISPPPWLFFPMWSGLFFLIALSLKELIDKKYTDKQLKTPITLLLTQLIINFAWGVIYGVTKDSVLGTITLIFSWFFVLFTLIEFRNLNKKAGYLLIPYLAWSTCAVIVSLGTALT
jgi:benzodiazapine receptor